MTSYKIEQLDALDDDSHFDLVAVGGATLTLPAIQRAALQAAHASWVEEEELDPELFDAAAYTDFDLYSELRTNEVEFPRFVVCTLAYLDTLSDDDHFDLAHSSFAVLAVSDAQRAEMAEIRDEFLDDLAGEGIDDGDRPSCELTNAEIYHHLRMNGIDFERIDTDNNFNLT